MASPHGGILATNLAGIAMPTPIVLAAGTAGTLDEMGEILDLTRVGAVTSKSITREPRAGNSTWRILPHPSGAGMLNAIGLANPGIEAFEAEYLPRAAAMDCAVIGSIAGFSVDDYVAVAAAMAEHVIAGAGDGHGASGRVGEAGGVRALELNLSCPNVRHGVEFGASPGPAAEVVRAVRAAVSDVPLFVKLSPVAPEIATIARAVVEAGATGLTIGNTIPAMAIDVESRRPLLANITGGLSGPALHAAALRSVWEVFNKFGRDHGGPGKHLPIIGLGGVTGWRDAAEFILAGATAAGIGTMLFADPRAPVKIARGLERWVTRQGRQRIPELIGAVELPQ